MPTILVLLLSQTPVTKSDCEAEKAKLTQCQNSKGECKPYEVWIKKFCQK